MTTNTIGPGGALFPVGAHIEEVDGVLRTWLHPLALADAADLLTERAQPCLLLSYVDHLELAEDATQLRPLEEVLGRRDIEVVASDSGVAIIRSVDLPRLVGDLYAYGFLATDLPSADVDLADAWCNLNARRDPSDPGLLHAPSSSLLIDSHDDCYLLVESRDRNLGPRLVARLLALLAGTVAHRQDIAVADIPEPDLASVRIALGPTMQLSLDQAAVRASTGTISLPFARRWSRAFDAVPQPDHELVLDLAGATWTVGSAS